MKNDFDVPPGYEKFEDMDGGKVYFFQPQSVAVNGSK
jgi:hypothetical protein